MRGFAIVSVMLVGAVAFAGGGTPLVIDVGQTIERTVGNANGWFCDDPSLVSAQIVTRGDTNVWVVTGAKPGTTQCRVGTDVTRASTVFDVTVNPARAKRR